MNHLLKTQHRERGQSAVIVALVLVAIMALMAITFDGAHAYFRRRLAQTAADAGALAGARELCITGDYAAAEGVAVDYATNHNQATEAAALAANGTVSVSTTITFPTTFGNIVGIAEMTTGANAEAGCFAPYSGTGVLPIAYSCQDGVLVDEDGDRYCDVLNYDNKYIIMNSRKVDEDVTCISDGGTVDCDWNDDGIDDLLLGGDRSWLDLNGSGRDDGTGGGSAAMCNWIQNGFSGNLRIHTWVSGQPGVTTNTFGCVTDIIGETVLLPVYDAVIVGSSADVPMPYDSDEDQIIVNNGNKYYFHIISFAIFVPDCVRLNNSDTDCALANAFLASGVMDNNDKSIEGYFIHGFADGLEGQPSDGVDAGAYTLYLTQ